MTRLGLTMKFFGAQHGMVKALTRVLPKRIVSNAAFIALNFTKYVNQSNTAWSKVALLASFTLPVDISSVHRGAARFYRYGMLVTLYEEIGAHPLVLF